MRAVTCFLDLVPKNVPKHFEFYGTDGASVLHIHMFTIWK